MTETLILGLLATLFGTGFIGMLVKAYIDRNKTKAETAQIETDAEGKAIANETAQLEQIARKSKVLKELLEDSEANTEKIQSLNEYIDKAQTENTQLKIEVSGQKYIIGYQITERQEWMMMLQRALDANSKRDSEIKHLTEVQEHHTKEIQECAERDNLKAAQISRLVSVLNEHHLDIPADIFNDLTDIHQTQPQAQSQT